MTPIRIQRKRTKGYKTPANTVFVGRPTRWGNPFDDPKLSNAEKVRLYEAWITELMAVVPAIRDNILKLRGKNLACWCKLSEPCHADVLLRIANEDAK
jgi:hypothetical protein